MGTFRAPVSEALSINKTSVENNLTKPGAGRAAGRPPRSPLTRGRSDDNNT